MSTTDPLIKCASGDGKNATVKLTASASIHVCEDHREFTKAGLQEEVNAAVATVKGVLQKEQQLQQSQQVPTPPASPPLPTQPTTSTTPTPTTSTPPPLQTTTTADKYGIKKLYPDATEGDKAQVWYMDMDNPTKDPKFKNWKNANLRKESDGGWYSDGSKNGKYQVRLEGWSESGQKKFLNCETTVYAQYINDIASGNPGAYAFQVYRGGGHHSSNTPCEGAAYKGRIRKDRGVAIVKEVLHPDYTSNRGGIKKLTKDPKGNYIGTKLVVYNVPVNLNETHVKIELWVDESGMSPDGVFDPSKQNWVKVAETIDKGGWASGDGGGCPPLDKHNKTGKRQPDEILNMPGGTSAGNLGAYRTDGVKSKVKYFSIREIKAPV